MLFHFARIPQIILVADFDAVFSEHLESFRELKDERRLKELEFVSWVLLIDSCDFSLTLSTKAFENSDECVADFSENFVVMISESEIIIEILIYWFT